MDTPHRAIILEEYPQQEPELPTRSSSELQEILYSYLRDDKPALFTNRIAELSAEFLDESLPNYRQTYLYVACKKGYIEVVDALLEKDVQLNTLSNDSDLSSFRKITPLAVAAYIGHHEIVKKLITHNAQLQITSNIEEAGSALTFVIRGMNQQGISKDTHRVILRLLLTYDSKTQPALDINHRDEEDMTPLHLAIALNDEFATKSLLSAGANLYLRDPYGRLPLTSLPATILENYFDECITLEKRRSHLEVHQAVTFDYSIFEPVDQKLSISNKIKFIFRDAKKFIYRIETDFFYQIKQKSELRPLLKHPLLESFLYVKWCLIKKYYFFSFAFYLSFCVILNMFIFLTHDCRSSSTSYNSSQSTDTDISHPFCNAWVLFVLEIITYHFITMYTLLIISLTFPLSWTYFRSFENLLRMMMVIAFYWAIWTKHAFPAAIVNLLSGIQLVFLLGKHPRFAIYVEVFKIVTLNFVKIFALFSILVASFARSFYLLFRNESKEYTSSKNGTDVDPSNRTIQTSINSWSGLKVSLIKSIIMMTGEFEASSLPLGENSDYSVLCFFCLFIFFVTMVLYNLLNGLAVNDTQAIIKDSETIAVMSRVEKIWQFEYLCHGKGSLFLRKHFPAIFDHRFFNDVLTQQQKKLTVDSILKYRIKFAASGKIIGKMPLAIIKHAEQIVEKRNHNNSVKDTNQSISRSIDEAVDKISEQIRNLNLEIDGKIAEMNVRNDEMNAQINDRVEKLLRSVETNNRKLEIVEKNTEMNAKIVDRVEKLVQSVERNIKLIDEKIAIVMKNC
ncbi:transient receptor potential cation channel protein painless-like [Planococcus citri]|uniref:transient receptor potential cation channel protein painless-like n=1 Tax=Planococcus citri TaxID=170843 RepID=UPI0031F77435